MEYKSFSMCKHAHGGQRVTLSSKVVGKSAHSSQSNVKRLCVFPVVFGTKFNIEQIVEVIPIWAEHLGTIVTDIFDFQTLNIQSKTYRLCCNAESQCKSMQMYLNVTAYMHDCLCMHACYAHKKQLKNIFSVSLEAAVPCLVSILCRGRSLRRLSATICFMKRSTIRILSPLFLRRHINRVSCLFTRSSPQKQSHNTGDAEWIWIVLKSHDWTLKLLSDCREETGCAAPVIWL